ncbi:MAG: hypothetical protein IJF90_06220 [Synergistaceae bacterium]|nr:hypothetical protein [Synergistaceae bacterium]
MEGNRIFKALLEEANKENERQAGKIIGKILAEAREEEKETYRACIKQLGRMPFGEDFDTFKDALEYVCRNVGRSDTAEISCEEIGGRWYYEGSNVGSHSGAFIVNYGHLYTEEEWNDRD